MTFDWAAENDDPDEVIGCKPRRFQCDGPDSGPGDCWVGWAFEDRHPLERFLWSCGLLVVLVGEPCEGMAGE